MEFRIKWLPFPCQYQFPQPMLEPPISQSTHWPPQQLSVRAFLLTRSCCCLTLTHCGSSCSCFFYFHSQVSLWTYICSGLDLAEGILSCILCYIIVELVGPVHLQTCSFWILKASLKAVKMPWFFDARPIGPLETDFSIERLHLKIKHEIFKLLSNNIEKFCSHLFFILSP